MVAALALKRVLLKLRNLLEDMAVVHREDTEASNHRVAMEANNPKADMAEPSSHKAATAANNPKEAMAVAPSNRKADTEDNNNKPEVMEALRRPHRAAMGAVVTLVMAAEMTHL